MTIVAAAASGDDGSVERYANLSGKSPISRFVVRQDSINVEFPDGTYLYTYASAGPLVVEEMKSRARKGLGLATYIAKEVRKRFASRERGVKLA
jgi:hypothetical protein